MHQIARVIMLSLINNIHGKRTENQDGRNFGNARVLCNFHPFYSCCNFSLVLLKKFNRFQPIWNMRPFVTAAECVWDVNTTFWRHLNMYYCTDPRRNEICLLQRSQKLLVVTSSRRLSSYRSEVQLKEPVKICAYFCFALLNKSHVICGCIEIKQRNDPHRWTAILPIEEKSIS